MPFTLRKAGLVELVEGDEIERGAALLPDESEGACADGLVRRRFPPDHESVVVAEPARQRRLRLLGDKPDGRRVEDLDALDPLELGAHIGGRLLAGDLLDRPFHVLGGDRLAIMEDAALAQLEDPGALAVDATRTPANSPRNSPLLS